MAVVVVEHAELEPDHVEPEPDHAEHEPDPDNLAKVISDNLEHLYQRR